MSGEIEVLGAVARIALAVLGPAIEAALAGGEPEADVIARLSGMTLVVRDTTAEDRARRARLEAAAAAVSRVSDADIDVARRAVRSAVFSGEERASVLRLAAHVEHVLRIGRAVDDTREIPT